jgi:hypothetical protein
MHPTCRCVLSQKNPNDSDVCRARPLGPSDIIDTGTVDEGSEDELADWCFVAVVRIAIAREVAPSTYHQTEMLSRYLRMRTPKVLIVPASGSLCVSRD